MTRPIDPQRVRALAERLIAVSSVSPDPEGEAACARVLTESLPAGIERGSWLLPDGRPVVWGLLRGRASRTVLILGHFDTVGIEEYLGLGDGEGSRIALRPDAIRQRLLGSLALR